MPAHIVPQARSTYRALLRASSRTFAGSFLKFKLSTHADPFSTKGDKASQFQFRHIIRQTFASPTLSSPLAPPPAPAPPTKPLTPCETKAAKLTERSSSSLAPIEAEQMTEAEYAERLKHWREVAAILRQNVVQGRKVETPAKEEDGDVWSKSILLIHPYKSVRILT